MQITLQTKPFAGLETDALVSYVFEEADPVQGRIAEIDQAAAGLPRKLAKSGELTGKMLEFTLVHTPAGLKSARLLLVGAGKREQWNSAVLRKIAGAALRYLKARSVKNFTLLVREGHATEEAAQAIAEGALAANFETDKYKTDKKNDKNIETVLLAGFSDADRAAGEKGLSKGRIIADAQNFTRDLVNEPSNKLTPRILAEKAEAMAKEAGLAVEILDEKKIADLKMGALLSVAQGHGRHLYARESKTRRSRDRPRRQSRHLRHRRHFHQARRGHGKNEVRHGRRRHHARRYARSRRSQAQRQSDLRRAFH
jgi:leucyl aminopeptidase